MELRKDYIGQLKKFEGFRAKAYKPAGEKDTAFYTIGYGHYGAEKGDTITRAEAHDLLLSDLDKVQKQILDLFPKGLCLSSDRWTALVDFVFNVGIGNFQRSTLYKYIRYNPNDWRIPSQFLRWVYSGDKKLPGLERRRRYCVRLWNSML